MKSIRQSLGLQVSLLVTTTLAGSFILATYFLFQTLQKGFEELENRETQIHIARVAETTSKEVGILATRLPDWAEWDDSAEYMRAKNQRFEEANLVSDVLDQMQMDSVRFYTLDRRLQGNIDRIWPSGASLGEVLDRELPKAEVLWPEGDDSATISGLIRLGSELFIVATQGIRPTSGEGPALGRLFFLKKVDQNLPLAISKLVKLPIEMSTAIQTIDGPETFSVPREQLQELPLVQNAIYKKSSEQQTFSHLVLRDLSGIPVLQLSFYLQRDLMAQGRRSILSVAMAFAMTIAVTLLVLLFGLDRLIIHRILSLTKGVQAITDKTQGAGQSHVPVSGESEVSILAQQINQMLDTIRDQHKAIDDIIQNVHAGFVIMDRDGKITPSYTAHFRDFFPGVENFEGKKLSSLLFETNTERENFDSLYEQAIEQILTEDLTLTQLPSLIQRGEHWLKLESSGLYDAQQKMTGVLFTLTDVTQQIEVERQNAENKALLKILRSLNHFASFKESTRHALETWRNEPHIAQKQLQIRRFLHTLKGNFGIYGLQHLAHIVHTIEAQPLIGLRHLDEVTEAFGEFLNNNRDIIGMEYDATWRPQISLSREALLDFRLQFTEAKSKEEFQQLGLAFIDSAIRQPFRDGVKYLLEESKRLAKRLHKSIEVQVVGGEVMLDLEGMRTVLDALVHPLRNAIDHGIEPSDRRQLLGKSRTGLITFLARRTGPQSYCLEITDDGQGVNFERLRAVVETSHSEFRQQSFSEEQLLEMIFVDGISTAPIQTEISGRGVGMSVLKAAVEKWGGHVRILSHPQLGCTVRIEWTER